MNITHIPQDIVKAFFVYLDPVKDLPQVERTCKAWHRICQDPSFWKIYLDCNFRDFDIGNSKEYKVLCSNFSLFKNKTREPNGFRCLDFHQIGLIQSMTYSHSLNRLITATSLGLHAEIEFWNPKTTECTQSLTLHSSFNTYVQLELGNNNILYAVKKEIRDRTHLIQVIDRSSGKVGTLGLNTHSIRSYGNDLICGTNEGISIFHFETKNVTKFSDLKGVKEIEVIKDFLFANFENKLFSWNLKDNEKRPLEIKVRGEKILSMKAREGRLFLLNEEKGHYLLDIWNPDEKNLKETNFSWKKNFDSQIFDVAYGHIFIKQDDLSIILFNYTKAGANPVITGDLGVSISHFQIANDKLFLVQGSGVRIYDLLAASKAYVPFR